MAKRRRKPHRKPKAKRFGKGKTIKKYGVSRGGIRL